MKANSSRPVPNGGGGGFASWRAIQSSSTTSALSSPRLAQSRTISPSQSLAIAFDDPDLAIPWPLPAGVMSDADRAARPLAELGARLAEVTATP